MEIKKEKSISNKLKSDGFYVIENFLKKKRFKQKFFRIFKKKRKIC